MTPDLIEALDPEAMAVAEAQALDDAALMAALRERAAEVESMTDEERATLAGDMFASPSEALRPISRAERRAMVKQFAAKLRNLPRAVPARNPTIRFKHEGKGHR